MGQTGTKVSAPSAMASAGTVGQAAAFGTQIKKMKDLQAAFNTVNSMSGKYNVTSVVSASATEKFSTALARNNLGIKAVITQRKMLNNVIKEQIGLQNASVVSFGRNSIGQTMSSVLVPKNFVPTGVNQKIKQLTTTLGVYGQAMKSAGRAGGEFARGLQRTGFQITQGIGVPLLAAATVAGVVYYKVDQQLTRIAKVYDTTAQSVGNSLDQQAAKQRELDALRESSTRNAQMLAQKYGSSITDTLSAEAELAATGARGIELLKATNEVQRAAVLGELDQQDAIKATIALQGIYNMSSQQLADTFNMMNSVENQTSLSMQDMVQAFPKILPVMKELGLDTKETSVLLTGMKASGINAVEGANGLRTGIVRMLRPTKVVMGVFEDLGIEIEDIPKKANGSVVKMLQILNERTKDLDKVSKTKAFATLFGANQAARMSAVASQMANINDATTQVGRAYEIVNGKSSDWAKTAEYEMATLQESASRRFKKMIAVIQGQLIEFGKPVLAAGTMILGVFSKLLNFFNGMSDGAKKALIVSTVFILIAGSTFVVIGAFANLLLSVMAVTGGIITFLTNFRMLSPEILASRIATNQATQALATQNGVLNTATSRLGAYASAARQAAAAQLGLAGSARNTGAVMPASTSAVQGPQPVNGAALNGGYMMAGSRYTSSTNAAGKTSYRADGKFTSEAAFRQAETAAKTAAAQSAKIAANAAASRVSFMGMAGAAVGIGMIAGAVKQIKDDGKASASSMTMMATALLVMGPSMMAVAKAGKELGVKAMASGWKAAAGSLAGMVGPVGLVLAGLVAAGIAIYSINKKMKEWNTTNKEIAKSTEAWSSILGYASISTDKSLDKAGKTLSYQETAAKQLKEQNEGLYNSLKNEENQQEKVNKARQEGFKVLASGGSQANIEAAMRTALHISGVDGVKQDQAVKVNMDIIIANPEEIKTKVIKETGDLLATAAKQVDQRNFVANLFNADVASSKAKSTAQEAANAFLVVFNSEMDAGAQGDLLKSFTTQWNKQSEKEFEKIKKQNKNAKIFDDLGIRNMTDLTREFALATKASGAADRGFKQSADVLEGGNKKLNARLALFGSLSDDAKQYIDIEKTTAKTIAGNGDAMNDNADKVSSLSDLNKRYAGSTTKAKEATGGLGESLNGTTDELTDAGAAAENTTQSIEDMRSKMVDAAKSVMDTTMDAAYDAFADKRSKDQEAALDRIESSGQSRLDKLDAAEASKEAAFDARQERSDNDFKQRQKNLQAQQKTEDKNFETDWKKVMDDHDERFDAQKQQIEDEAQARIDGIDKALDAEQKAEDIRQRIFEAEQTRISRLAEQFNNNIDFNAALSSGNLDEAAKIQNNASASSLQNASQDASAVAGSSSAVRSDALEAQKTLLETQKDEAIKNIETLEEAEKEQLDSRKDREQELLQIRQDAANEQLQNEQDNWNKSLKQEQDRAQKSTEAQKKMIQDQTNASKKGAQDQFDAANKSLEQQLAALKAMTPRNESELNDHIGRLQGLYNNFGTSYIKPTSKTWGNEFGAAQTAAFQTAAATLQNDVNWSQLGQSITDEMAQAFDLNGSQLVEWLKTGIFPGGSPGVTSSGVSTAGSSASSGQMGRGVNFKHSGGGMGWSSADRVGIPRSASLFPSETPAILKRGEFVVNERGARSNAGLLNAINSGNGVVRHAGGSSIAGSGIGSSGLIGAAVAKALMQGIARTLQSTTQQMTASAGYGVGTEGKYGNINLSGEQLKNASTIMNVGKSKGASQRDLVIALMTAMQESNLKNLSYGDRDSVGLFQQRTSQGWGTIEQIMNPEYSAGKFFDALFKVKNRDSLAPTQAAQKVQRSGFPEAYAKWQAMAEAVVNGTPTMMVPGVMPGAGVGVSGIKPVGKNGYTYPAMMQIMDQSGVPHQVTSTKRNGDGGSYHNKGMAVDFDDFSSPKVDTPGLLAIWKYLYQKFAGVSSEIIYAGPGATSIKNGKPYSYSDAIRAGHHNHVHWAMTPEAMGKIGVPSLAVGGNINYDNVLTNLHKGETVLTSPLSNSLTKGIENISNGGDRYTINVMNPVVRNDTDIDAIVSRTIGALSERDRRNGRSKVVGRNG